jgi:hypothetical protein
MVFLSSLSREQEASHVSSDLGLSGTYGNRVALLSIWVIQINHYVVKILRLLHSERSIESAPR